MYTGGRFEKAWLTCQKFHNGKFSIQNLVNSVAQGDIMYIIMCAESFSAIYDQLLTSELGKLISHVTIDEAHNVHDKSSFRVSFKKT